MWNPRVSGSGNAKLSTAFDVIRRFILLFAWGMPEIGFIGTAVSKRFHRCAIDLVLSCVPGLLGANEACAQGLQTLKRGSGNLTILMSTMHDISLLLLDEYILNLVCIFATAVGSYLYAR